MAGVRRGRVLRGLSGPGRPVSHPAAAARRRRLRRAAGDRGGRLAEPEQAGPASSGDRGAHGRGASGRRATYRGAGRRGGRGRRARIRGPGNPGLRPACFLTGWLPSAQTSNGTRPEDVNRDMSYDPSHRMPPRQERWPGATPAEGWPSYQTGAQQAMATAAYPAVADGYGGYAGTADYFDGRDDYRRDGYRQDGYDQHGYGRDGYA